MKTYSNSTEVRDIELELYRLTWVSLDNIKDKIKAKDVRWAILDTKELLARLEDIEHRLGGRKL